MKNKTTTCKLVQLHTACIFLECMSQARGPTYIHRVTVGIEVNFWALCNILVNYSYVLGGGINPLMNQI